MDINLDEKRKKLIELKHEYNEKIKSIEQQIESIESQIYNQCAIKNNGHKWIRERDEGPYAETFFYCEYCRCGE